MTTTQINVPPSVSRTEFEAAHQGMLAKEKALTHEKDALAAERRRLPRYKMEKNYVFDGPEGKKSLLELFGGRPQLILYSFMFAPGVNGWPDAGCPGCSFFIDNMGNLDHLRARDVSFVVVSRAPLEKLQQYQKRMGWTMPWYSSANTDFNADIGVTTPKGEDHRVNAFYRDGNDVYYTYYTSARGTEQFSSVWNFLDVSALGRQELWEDSPKGYPQSPPYQWWRRHDEYGAEARQG